MTSLASAAQTQESTCKSEKPQPPVLISNGLPPVPASLVEQGLFIEMAELSPRYLDSAELNTGKQFIPRRYSALGSIWQLYLVQYLNVLLI